MCLHKRKRADEVNIVHVCINCDGLDCIDESSDENECNPSVIWKKVQTWCNFCLFTLLNFDWRLE